MSIPFSAQGTGVLWFMYALIGFYLIIPIISPWLQKATSKEVLLYISLFLISTTYPFLNQIVNLDSSTSNILYYFASYGGYFLLGWYMEHFGLHVRWRYLCLAYAAMLALPAVFLICGEREYFWQMINYLTLPVVIMSIFWFATAQRFSKAIDGLSERAKKSNCTSVVAEFRRVPDPHSCHALLHLESKHYYKHTLAHRPNDNNIYPNHTYINTSGLAHIQTPLL